MFKGNNPPMAGSMQQPYEPGSRPYYPPQPAYPPRQGFYPGRGPPPGQWPPVQEKTDTIPPVPRLLMVIPFWIFMTLCFLAIFPALAIVTPELWDHAPPAQIPIPAGIISIVYFLFIMVMILGSFFLLFHRDGRELAGAFRRWKHHGDRALKDVKNNSFVLIAEFFMADLALLLTYFIALTIFGHDLHVPSSLTESKLWELMFMLAEASVMEELVCRVLLIGIPLLFIDSHPSRKRRAAHRYLTGGGFELDTPAVTLLLFSSIIFGMAHIGWDWSKALITGIGAAFFAYLFLKRGLYAAILLHFAFDYNSILADWANDSTLEIMGIFLFVLLGLIGFFALLHYVVRTIHFFGTFRFDISQLKLSGVAATGIMFLLMGILFITSLTTDSPSDTIEDDYEVDAHSTESIKLWVGNGEEMELEANAAGGSSISIYIFNETEYDKWKAGNNAEYIYRSEGVAGGDFSGKGKGEYWVFALGNDEDEDVHVEMEISRTPERGTADVIFSFTLCIVFLVLGLFLLATCMNLELPGLFDSSRPASPGAQHGFPPAQQQPYPLPHQEVFAPVRQQPYPLPHQEVFTPSPHPSYQPPQFQQYPPMRQRTYPPPPNYPYHPAAYQQAYQQPNNYPPYSTPPPQPPHHSFHQQYDPSPRSQQQPGGQPHSTPPPQPHHHSFHQQYDPSPRSQEQTEGQPHSISPPQPPSQTYPQPEIPSRYGPRQEFQNPSVESRDHSHPPGEPALEPGTTGLPGNGSLKTPGVAGEGRTHPEGVGRKRGDDQ